MRFVSWADGTNFFRSWENCEFFGIKTAVPSSTLKMRKSDKKLANNQYKPYTIGNNAKYGAELPLQRWHDIANKAQIYLYSLKYILAWIFGCRSFSLSVPLPTQFKYICWVIFSVLTWSTQIVMNAKEASKPQCRGGQIGKRKVHFTRGVNSVVVLFILAPSSLAVGIKPTH